MIRDYRYQYHEPREKVHRVTPAFCSLDFGLPSLPWRCYALEYRYYLHYDPNFVCCFKV